MLAEMRSSRPLTAFLSEMIAIFLKVTESYFPGLFHCYDVVDLPRTNNDLEHVFGSTRYHERRATGRKQASPGLVVRGSVRLVATIATQQYHFNGSDLAPRNLAEWRILRNKLTIGMKLDVSILGFGKILNAIYVLWRINYSREKCGSSFFSCDFHPCNKAPALEPGCRPGEEMVDW